MSFSSTSFNADIYPFNIPQIVGWIAKKALIKIPNKYVNFANIFSLDLVSKLQEHTGINNYAIKLVDSQQLPYQPIYSLELIKLKILKAYIEINLANRFIKLFKLPISTPILFNQK